MKKIIVIGSSNVDMVVRTSHLPAPGETILGGEFFMNQGGKGANQAMIDSVECMPRCVRNNYPGATKC